MRVLPALLVVLLLPLFTGCGSTRTAGSAASVVPADVAVYVSMDTSFDGAQWRAVSDLVGKFPEGEGALDELLDQAAQSAGLSGGDDLEDALGPEVGIAVLEFPEDGDVESSVVLLTQPADTDAFQELVQSSGAASGEVRGWQAAAGDEAALERYRDSLDGPSLEGSAAFTEAMDGLDEDALVRVYVDGGAVVRALASQPGLPAGALSFLSGEEPGSIGAIVQAEGDGVRLEGQAVGGEHSGTGAVPYVSELAGRVPDGALAFLSFHDLGASLGDAGGVGLGLLGVDPSELAGLFSGESAVYVRPGDPEPSVTLVTQVEDEAAALAAVKRLVGLAGEAKDTIAYEAFDGLLAVSTSRAELDALRGGGGRLDRDDDFERALERSGLPDETTGFGYVNLRETIPLLLGIAGAPAAGIPDVNEYLEPLSGVVFWGSNAGAARRFSLFVGVA